MDHGPQARAAHDDRFMPDTFGGQDLFVGSGEECLGDSRLHSQERSTFTSPNRLDHLLLEQRIDRDRPKNTIDGDLRGENGGEGCSCCFEQCLWLATRPSAGGDCLEDPREVANRYTFT